MMQRALALLALAFAVIFALPGCSKYDELVQKDETCKQKWSDYEAQLTRRAELIPNLVSTVKAAANYEESTLTKITNARASANSIKLSGDDLSDPEKVKKFEQAQAQLSPSALRGFLITSENYPKLQASSQYTDMMKQLEGTENRILRSRQEYNDVVKDYNSTLRKIGGSVVNKATNQPFKERAYFTAAPESTAAPKVSF